MSSAAPRPQSDVTPLPPRSTATQYELRCLADGDRFADPTDTAPLLVSPTAQRPALLRAEYRRRRLQIDDAAEGLYRFHDWLPIRRMLPGAPGPVTFRAQRLGAVLGLPNLFITATGWWPERGTFAPTGTFKELEAYAVYGRLADRARHMTLVVASAGNTARAFLRVASQHDLPLVVVVPEDNLASMWSVGRPGRSTLVVAVGGGADYSDAIATADLLCQDPAFLPEGGARNVARRDGMGTTFLSAATTIGRIPDHYFQAVGSGTGAIAAWEANIRLVRDGRYGTHLARLHLAQNAPFQVLVDSWRARSRELEMPDEATLHAQVREIRAPVLANRRPPYGPVGGLFDALEASRGEMYAVANPEAAHADALMRRHERIDPSPAAAVAIGALVQAVERGTVGRHDVISLNLTGCGLERARAELDTQPLTADLVLDRTINHTQAIADAVRAARDQKQRSADAAGTEGARR